ncbi:CBL-interacting serine/threonine-protein kinase 21 [Amaranthus tricolor]|uniref:CBL-interacting serine/threonine-protein kinase 21 n=1 Tax=Amaranthus tricolor TaxID=29722 RepID=UPI002585DDA8|nr:CBL-interacting serine/threonine-protein kinase 21 [Amaranthus tricolor]
MGIMRNVGKYQLGSTIGEGTFAKVKLARNIINNQIVAIKIIDKEMVLSNNLMSQVQREIRTMKLLNHPNIVRIHEVIGTKTKIYIVMEYVSGGQLSDKLFYAKKLSESDARKYFQQLIDAIDYCHSRGVYHRDLKPENLLLDSKGNLKVSDFGLSALQKPGTLLSTACGSPSYVAPELLKKKGYHGAAVDVWACGVILFELLAGYLPFDDPNLMTLYTKIWRAEYECPNWFSQTQKKLIARILNPVSRKRITVAEIMEDEWFKTNYEPATGINLQRNDITDDVQAVFEPEKESSEDENISETRGFINAFQLIAMSYELDLSALFEENDDKKNRIMLGSKYTVTETIQKIEAAARNASFSIEMMSNSKVQMQLKSKSRSTFNLLAEVIKVAPTDCVVQVSKSVGESGIYQQFCRSLSSLLNEDSNKNLNIGFTSTKSKTRRS